MATRLYGVLWRWHFLAGLAACPVLFVVAITGALYAFQPELERLSNPQLLVVEPAGPRRSVAELMTALPAGCTPSGVSMAPGADHPVSVGCAGTEREVFLDPYRGTKLGERVWEDTFFGIVFRLHWELMLGEKGRLAVEWATSWAMLLMLSGAALWWPRGGRRRGGVWYPRRKLDGRQWLRDLHAVIGAYALPVLLAIAATGLFWTALAGQDRWHEVAADAAHERAERPPVSSPPPSPGAAPIGYDAALAAAGIDPAREWRAFYIGAPDGDGAPYTIYTWDHAQERPSAVGVIWVDAFTGARLGQVGWADRTWIGKLDTSGYPIHVGSLLGLAGRIAATLAALVLAALCVTGPWMWWKRRPSGGMGVPPPARRVVWPLLALLAGLGWVLPTVGYTLLAVAAVELALWGWNKTRTAI